MSFPSWKCFCLGSLGRKLKWGLVGELFLAPDFFFEKLRCFPDVKDHHDELSTTVLDPKRAHHRNDLGNFKFYEGNSANLVPCSREWLCANFLPNIFAVILQEP